MITNPLDVVKLIKEPLDRRIPNKLKGKVKLRIAKPGTKVIRFKSKGVVEIEPNGNFNVSKVKNTLLSFKGLNSKIAYVNLEGDNLQEIRQEILNDMDEKETKLVLNAVKKFGDKKITMIRRRISPEIAKLMGMGKKIQRALIVHPVAITKEGDKSGKFYYGVYGYESIIMTLINKGGK